MANETDGSNDFPKAYIQFRSMLDGLELTAMRYFLKDNDETQRIARAEEFEQKLIPIITEYQNKMSSASEGKMNMSLTAIQIECPEGCFNCGSYCLAYPCP